jgi:hypothetical protein
MGRMLFVTNTNDFPHEDAYDGESYTFLPGEKVAISEEVATHCFGWNLLDKTNTLQRLGWATRYDSAKKTLVDDEEGILKLARFVFSEAVLVEKPLEKALKAASSEIA